MWSDFYEISLGERICMAVQSGSVLLLRPWPAERGGSCGKTQNMISVLYILGIIKTKLASVSLCCKSRRFKQQITKFYSQVRRTFMSVNSPKKAISFLLLVTISIVWYVFFAFNNLFFLFHGERAPASEDLDLPWCPVVYFIYCLFTL